MVSCLNIESLAGAEVHQAPFPYFVLDKAIREESIASVMEGFPAITAGGSFTLDGLQCGEGFSALIDELNGPEFRSLISDKLGMDLNTLPMIVTLRGVSRPKDGRVHTDSKSKIATILIYFNDDWTAETGKLRILNSDNLEDMADEVIPNAGTLLGFRVTDNCWHGYPPFDGIRRSIQINFVADENAVKKHHNRHGLTAKLKKWFGTH